MLLYLFAFFLLLGVLTTQNVQSIFIFLTAEQQSLMTPLFVFSEGPFFYIVGIVLSGSNGLLLGPLHIFLELLFFGFELAPDLLFRWDTSDFQVFGQRICA